MRREIKADVKKQHDLYVNNMVGDIKLIPETSTGTLIVKRKTRKVSHLEKEEMAAVLAESGLEQTDEFNGQFTDVFNKSEQSVAS